MHVSLYFIYRFSSWLISPYRQLSLFAVHLIFHCLIFTLTKRLFNDVLLLLFYISKSISYTKKNYTSASGALFFRICLLNQELTGWTFIFYLYFLNFPCFFDNGRNIGYNKISFRGCLFMQDIFAWF